MNMKTKIYGASDDLIIIEGAISEEAEAYKAKKVECSDGTKFTISYNGEWKIDITNEGHLIQALHRTGEGRIHTGLAKGCAAYSDVLILDNGIEWIKIGNKTFKV